MSGARKSGRILSDDELTELECLLLDACKQKARAGWRIRPGITYSLDQMECCPIGALIDADDPRRMCEGFTDGFDGRIKEKTLMALSYPDVVEQAEAFFDMGRRFRERWINGELNDPT